MCTLCSWTEEIATLPQDSEHYRERIRSILVMAISVGATGATVEMGDACAHMVEFGIACLLDRMAIEGNVVNVKKVVH